MDVFIEISGKAFGGGGAAGKFRSANLSKGGLVVGTSGVGALQAVINGRRGKGLVRGLVDEGELLPERQANHTPQNQLLLGEVVAGGVHDRIVA